MVLVEHPSTPEFCLVKTDVRFWHCLWNYRNDPFVHFVPLALISHTGCFALDLSACFSVSLHCLSGITSASQYFHFLWSSFMFISISLSIVLVLPVPLFSSALLFLVHCCLGCGTWCRWLAGYFSWSPCKVHLCPHPLRSRASLRNRPHLSASPQCVLARSASV